MQKLPIITSLRKCAAIHLVGMLDNFVCYFLSADFFSKPTFSKNSFRNPIRVSNSLDADLAQHFVGPDLDPSCLQTLSADGTS